MRKLIRVSDHWLDVKILHMRIGKTWLVALAVGTLIGLAGCNAISFFPHDAAEKAADKVIDDIFPVNGAREDVVTPAKPAPPKEPGKT